jgi:hypothetical protein
MKILVMVAMTAITAATAFAEETEAAPERKVTVCMDPGADSTELRSAQGLASKVFAKIRVKVDWRERGSCTAGGNEIQISLSRETPESDRPSALAYALPYEGSHIVVFYDRVRRSDANLVTSLLAYVMVHEVTHILEGITRHSKRGIMKAHWDREDRFEIGIGRLRFAEADVELIYSGLDARDSGTALAQARANSNSSPVAKK